MQAIALSSVVVRGTQCLEAEVDGEVVLMSVADALYFGLNAVGTDIWRRLAQPIRLADLCSTLAEEYEADIATIERDVLALVAKLAGRKLVEVRA